MTISPLRKKQLAAIAMLPFRMAYYGAKAALLWTAAFTVQHRLAATLLVTLASMLVLLLPHYPMPHEAIGAEDGNLIFVVYEYGHPPWLFRITTGFEDSLRFLLPPFLANAAISLLIAYILITISVISTKWAFRKLQITDVHSSIRAALVKGCWIADDHADHPQSG